MFLSYRNLPNLFLGSPPIGSTINLISIIMNVVSVFSSKMSQELALRAQSTFFSPACLIFLRLIPGTHIK